MSATWVSSLCPVVAGRVGTSSRVTAPSANHLKSGASQAPVQRHGETQAAGCFGACSSSTEGGIPYVTSSDMGR